MTLTQRITEVLQQRKIIQEKRERAAKREHLIDQITYLQQRKTKTQMQQVLNLCISAASEVRFLKTWASPVLTSFEQITQMCLASKLSVSMSIATIFIGVLFLCNLKTVLDVLLDQLTDTSMFTYVLCCCEYL